MSSLDDLMRKMVDAARERFCQQDQQPLHSMTRCLHLTTRCRSVGDHVLCVTLYGKKNDDMVFLPFSQLENALIALKGRPPVNGVPAFSTLMGVDVFVVADMVTNLVNDPQTQTLKGESGGELWLNPPPCEKVIEDYDNAELYQWKGTVVDNEGREETVILYEVDYFLYRLLQYTPVADDIIHQVTEKLMLLARYDEKECDAFRQDVAKVRQHIVQRIKIVN